MTKCGGKRNKNFNKRARAKPARRMINFVDSDSSSESANDRPTKRLRITKFVQISSESSSDSSDIPSRSDDSSSDDSSMDSFVVDIESLSAELSHEGADTTSNAVSDEESTNDSYSDSDPGSEDSLDGFSSDESPEEYTNDSSEESSEVSIMEMNLVNPDEQIIIPTTHPRIVGRQSRDELSAELNALNGDQERLRKLVQMFENMKKYGCADTHDLDNQIKNTKKELDEVILAMATIIAKINSL